MVLDTNERSHFALFFKWLFIQAANCFIKEWGITRKTKK